MDQSTSSAPKQPDRQAKKLKNALKEQGVDVKLSQVREALAKSGGDRHWNAFFAGKENASADPHLTTLAQRLLDVYPGDIPRDDLMAGKVSHKQFAQAASVSSVIVQHCP